MSAGLQVFGDHGNIQIDQNYVNMVLTNRGYATTVAGGLNGADTVDITITGTTPIICLDGYGVAVYIASISQSGNQFTFTLASNAAGTRIGWYIFDQVPNIQATNQGLTVWNASSKVVFNSDYEPLRMITFAQCSDGVPQWGTVNGAPSLTSMPPTTTAYGSYVGQRIAAFLSQPKGYARVLTESNVFGFVQSITVTNSSSTLASVITDDGTDSSGNLYDSYIDAGRTGGVGHQATGGLLVLVDVTNYYLP